MLSARLARLTRDIRTIFRVLQWIYGHASRIPVEVGRSLRPHRRGKASHRASQRQHPTHSLGTSPSRRKDARIWKNRDKRYAQRHYNQVRINQMGCTNCLCTPKKGFLRFSVDYRRLNAVPKCDLYLIPHMYECIDSLGKVTIFSKLNANSGY